MSDKIATIFQDPENGLDLEKLSEYLFDWFRNGLDRLREFKFGRFRNWIRFDQNIGKLFNDKSPNVGHGHQSQLH